MKIHEFILTPVKSSMNHFQAIIFDMDGLLLDTERLALSAFMEACAFFGLPEQHALFTRCIGTNRKLGRQILADGLRGLMDPLKLESEWDRRYVEYTTRAPVPLKHGVTQLLEHIASLRIPIAVATSTRTSRAEQKLRSVGIADTFELIVGGDQVENGKPAPDIYLRAAHLLKVSATACLALEDSENGVRAALGAGMTVVQVPDLIAPSEALRALGHIVLPSLNEVATFPFHSAGNIQRESMR